MPSAVVVVNCGLQEYQVAQNRIDRNGSIISFVALPGSAKHNRPQWYHLLCRSPHFWQHGEIIESSYLLGEKGPRSTWTRVFEMVVLLATIGGCAYLTVFLFHNGNHHPLADDSPSRPHRPVGASSASMEDAACSNHPKCKCEPRRSVVFFYQGCSAVLYTATAVS